MAIIFFYMNWLYIVQMRISSKSKIAFQVLLDIAAHTAKGRAISIPLLCKRHQLSHSYLEIIFSQLKALGMIRSHRGPGGGYSLSRETKDISLYEIVCLMDDQEVIRDDLGVNLWLNLDRHMSLQMQQINLSEALQRSSIVIEDSTKGFSLSGLSASSKATKSLARKEQAKQPMKTKPRLGPNSVFMFGKYLKSL